MLPGRVAADHDRVVLGIADHREDAEGEERRRSGGYYCGPAVSVATLIVPALTTAPTRRLRAFRRLSLSFLADIFFSVRCPRPLIGRSVRPVRPPTTESSRRLPMFGCAVPEDTPRRSAF